MKRRPGGRGMNGDIPDISFYDILFFSIPFSDILR